MKAICKSLVATTVFGSVVMTYGCNSTGFKGSSRVVKTDPEPATVDYTIVAMGMDPTVQGGQVQMSTIDRLKFVFQAGDRRVVGTDTTIVQQAVDLYFVLDTTASMRDEMAAVKNGISLLVNELSRSGINLKVGLVGFVDSYGSVTSQTYKLSSNYSGFQTFLANIEPTGNEDYPEAAIYAARKAVEFLRNGSRNGSLKAMVVVTDVIGHNGSVLGGGKPTRDCSTGALVNDINSYATSLPRQDDFKFFYTVPDPARVTLNDENYGAFVTCDSQNNAGGYVAIRQMEEILGQILPAVPIAQRGGALRDGGGNVAWPLTQNNLVSTLVPMLQDNPVVRDVLGSCVATSAEIFEGDQRISRWQATPQDALNAMTSGDNTLSILDAVPSNGREGVRNLEALVNRCCVSAEDIRAGNISNCKTSYRQTIPFQLDFTAPRA